LEREGQARETERGGLGIGSRESEEAFLGASRTNKRERELSQSFVTGGSAWGANFLGASRTNKREGEKHRQHLLQKRTSKKGTQPNEP
jgi:hypothetical protein